MTAGSNAMLRTYAQDGQYASVIRPTGLAAASASSAQCTPQSTGMSPRSAKGIRVASAHASHVLLTGAALSGAREAGDDRGGGRGVATELDVVQAELLAPALERLDALLDGTVQDRRGRRQHRRVGHVGREAGHPRSAPGHPERQDADLVPQRGRIPPGGGRRGPYDAELGRGP